jgi:hypothetical protein
VAVGSSPTFPSGPSGRRRTTRRRPRARNVSQRSTTEYETSLCRVPFEILHGFSGVGSWIHGFGGFRVFRAGMFSIKKLEWSFFLIWNCLKPYIHALGLLLLPSSPFASSTLTKLQIAHVISADHLCRVPTLPLCMQIATVAVDK